MTSLQQLPHDLLAKLFPLVGKLMQHATLLDVVESQHFQQHNLSIKSRKPTILSFIGADHPLVEVQRRSAGDAMLVDLFGGHGGISRHRYAGVNGVAHG